MTGAFDGFAARDTGEGLSVAELEAVAGLLLTTAVDEAELPGVTEDVVEPELELEPGMHDVTTKLSTKICWSGCVIILSVCSVHDWLVNCRMVVWPGLGGPKVTAESSN